MIHDSMQHSIYDKLIRDRPPVGVCKSAASIYGEMEFPGPVDSIVPGIYAVTGPYGNEVRYTKLGGNQYTGTALWYTGTQSIQWRFDPQPLTGQHGQIFALEFDANSTLGVTGEQYRADVIVKIQDEVD
jgi:hypothetical protein